jgi:hypothetical protein
MHDLILACSFIVKEKNEYLVVTAGLVEAASEDNTNKTMSPHLVKQQNFK